MDRWLRVQFSKPWPKTPVPDSEVATRYASPKSRLEAGAPERGRFYALRFADEPAGSRRSQ